MRAALVVLTICAGAASADTIVSARYTDPTDRYAHAVLGDAIEHATLTVRLASGRTQSATWPPGMVFEDTEPRLVDLTGDGAPEVITVESSDTEGARLAVWGLDPRGNLFAMVSSPFIGQRFRWLAPLGAADLDGDGAMEIAWIDRPHLARTLAIWRFTQNGDTYALTQVDRLPGLTNHRIGERDIAGGIRDCGTGPELITADADWQNVMATTLRDGELTTRAIARHENRSSFTAPMACR